ncbi:MULTISPECIES: glycine zipper 2TM domain-containing protein [Pseudarthrobacter]|uniref:F0F1-type ATP synthase assembly protein I n=1 Tax=Pseudarthrobacter niigatensis TaxID=369935 RepID=A0AAJ1SXM7_9MICC|nr:MULTISPECIES: glycine zipper 2TM domain-containing protein [Pseudarthrobacter]MDQ0146343.1 F0F1-type ATP synthase assembly protein I [Pseudarthrobacter niigatensis]MDQ0264893.1 F0F1-type ATP synthase assembly protein I [Pseudarthrobacter niigatensis]QDG64156.1 glycine zipper 2TM domain-containing protein [Pseudarthrobacter sp. NIBRBAC000502771]QDG87783.1 glycine zipper 2TM domain-containing protein [Pseudarthrobacter sp. NIBRBAC000502770]
MSRKPHRNGRGLFLGAVLGAVVGYFAGRLLGNPGWGIILGTLAGAALLYRVNPGSRRRR